MGPAFRVKDYLYLIKREGASLKQVFNYVYIIKDFVRDYLYIIIHPILPAR